MLRPREGENLSAIIRWLLGYFARAYNKKLGWTGHFWGDRFHSRVLNGILDFAIAFGYIDDILGKWNVGAAFAAFRFWLFNG
ncbi:MAG: hypothetical protein ACOYM2_20020 [Rectinemataceae bacterium]